MRLLEGLVARAKWDIAIDEYGRVTISHEPGPLERTNVLRFDRARRSFTAMLIDGTSIPLGTVSGQVARFLPNAETALMVAMRADGTVISGADVDIVKTGVPLGNRSVSNGDSEYGYGDGAWS